METSLLEPDFPVPPGVRLISTTRLGGCSRPPWDSLNLGDHVGDDPDCVAANRERLREAVLPRAPVWLTQVHGTVIADHPALTRADGRYSERPGEVCAVLTADCLPVLFCDRRGSAVAAVHAGWRGLAAGILERAVARFAAAPADLLAWMGPAIGPRAFIVGEDVYQAFVQRQAIAASGFQRIGAGRWRADIYALAGLRLRSAGVHSIYGGGCCTVADGGRFFSYRRDGVTGRMASMIWIQEEE